MKCIVIVPTLNEEKKIKPVLLSMPDYLDVLVVDNASTDKTMDIVKRLNVPYILHKKNLGKAQSLIDGFNYALKNNYDVVISMDGDGEHNPSDIPRFLNKIKTSDMVFGQRKQFRSFGRNIMNKWCNLWFNLVLPKIDDVQCGFRAIRCSLLEKMDLSAIGFEIEINLLLEAVKNKAKIRKEFIDTTPRKFTNLTIKDYIKINNFFDRWILKNHKYLNMGPIKRLFLLVFTNIGLFIFRRFE